MKLVQSTTINGSTPVRSMTCKLCAAQYEITLADLTFEKDEKLMKWRCDTCGEHNSFADPDVEKKLAVLCKIRAVDMWKREND